MKAQKQIDLHQEKRQMKAESVREAISRTLLQRAKLDAERISVEVQEHSITISGRVKSLEEKMAIIGAVSELPGIMIINDQLRSGSLC